MSRPVVIDPGQGRSLPYPACQLEEEGVGVGNEKRIVRHEFPGEVDGSAVGACMVTQQDAGRWPK
jgi:hypothetical protein